MTERDTVPEPPVCPACDGTEHVQRHDAPHQGRWICMACMLLFEGTSAEWAKPTRERQDIRDELEAARAALREAAER